MPTLGLGRESDGHVPLFGDPDHRHRSGNAGDQSIGERAAFVQHELGMDVAGREQLRDAGRAAPPAHLLIVAERQVHGAPRLGSRPEEVLHRLAESDEAALVVERAPAPHISAGDPALEWRDRKSTRLNSSHGYISYAVFCLKKKKQKPLRPNTP